MICFVISNENLLKMAFVTGVGRTKFGVLKSSLAQLLYEAMTKAVDDAGVSIKDIDAIYVSNFAGGPFENQLHLNSLLSSMLPGLNLPVVRVEAACAAGSVALYQGLLSLSRFERVLVIGVEKMSRANGLLASKYISAASDQLLDQSQGLIFPAQYALIAEQHMLKHGTSKKDLANVAFKNHKNANLNSLAHFFHKEVSYEKIESAPDIASPFNLFDCSPISDGAAALVVSNNRDSDRAIEVLASELVTDSISLTQRDCLTSLAAVKIASRNAYEKAGVSPSEVSIAEVHDCFTIGEIIAMEDLGFCEPGQATKMISEGQTEISGSIPINTDGGLKADGHPIGATGIAQVIEVVHQLRHEAGDRQVKDANIGLSHNVGGTGGTACIHIFKK